MNKEIELYLDNRQEIEISEDIIECIKKAIREVLILEGKDLNYEISLSFVDNEEIKRLNREFREMDSSTDVLSFPMIDDLFPEIENPMLGDIIISVEKAVEQSKEYNHSFKREMVYLTVHSMLHLLGYDHLNEDEKKDMRSKEEQIMKILDIQR